MYGVKNSIRIYIASEYAEERNIGTYTILVVYNNCVIKTLKRIVKRIPKENIYFRALLEVFDIYNIPMQLQILVDNNDFVNEIKNISQDSYWYNKINYNLNKHIIDLKFIEFDDDFSDYAKLLSQKSLYYDN